MTKPSQFPETFTLDDSDVIPVIKGMPSSPAEHKIKVENARTELGGGGGSGGGGSGNALYTKGSGTNDTTSATFVNFPIGGDVTFTKQGSSSLVLVQAHLSLYTTVASTGAEFAVLIGSTDYPLAWFWINQANTHVSISGVVPVPGLGTGTVTGRLRWRRHGGTGILRTDANDHASLMLLEVG
jgi:hypothetical protein